MGYDDKFYIGRAYDPKTNETLEQPTLYDPDDLTTHGVVVGMTGSGKTGLGIDILEEAALMGLPAWPGSHIGGWRRGSRLPMCRATRHNLLSAGHLFSILSVVEGLRMQGYSMESRSRRMI